MNETQINQIVGWLIFGVALTISAYTHILVAAITISLVFSFRNKKLEAEVSKILQEKYSLLIFIIIFITIVNIIFVTSYKSTADPAISLQYIGMLSWPIFLVLSIHEYIYFNLSSNKT